MATVPVRVPEVQQADRDGEDFLDVERNTRRISSAQKVAESAEFLEQAQNASLDVPDGARDLVVGEFGSANLEERNMGFTLVG